jgi:hypothetical protein
MRHFSPAPSYSSPVVVRRLPSPDFVPSHSLTRNTSVFNGVYSLHRFRCILSFHLDYFLSSPLLDSILASAFLILRSFTSSLTIMQLLRSFSLLSLALSPLVHSYPGRQATSLDPTIEARDDWFNCGGLTVKKDRLADSGGFGEVYLGRRQTKRGTEPVAIKKFTAAQTGYSNVRYLPQSSKLMEVYATCTHKGAQYAITEWVTGDNLRKIAFSETETLNDQALSNIFTAALDGLRRLHANNPPLAHGDIKPANIMASQSRSRSTLIDYDYLTTSATKDHFCGSSRYVSPGKKPIQMLSSSNISACHRRMLTSL